MCRVVHFYLALHLKNGRGLAGQEIGDNGRPGQRTPYFYFVS